MALYGGLRSTHRLSAQALITENKRMMHGQITPTSITTTINTGMRSVESVMMTFVSAPSSAHSHNYYTTSTNGAVRMTHMFTNVASAASAGGPVGFATATAGWSRISYIIVGSEDRPAAS